MTRLRIPVRGPVFQHYTPVGVAHGVKWSHSRYGWLLSGGAFGHAFAIGWMRQP